jgi:hypothetical protein
MLTYLRYSLATVCFSASVGSLAVSLFSFANSRIVNLAAHLGEADEEVSVMVMGQIAIVSVGKSVTSDHSAASMIIYDLIYGQRRGMIGQIWHCFYFPTWYASAVAAFAGVGVLRLGRRFTLRAALIATTIVTLLLGMAVYMSNDPYQPWSPYWTPKRVHPGTLQ